MATRILTLIALLIAVVLAPLPALAQDDFAAQINALGPGSFADRTKAMDVLVATGDERVPPVLQALSDGNLYIREADGKVVIAKKAGRDLAMTDPVDGADLGSVPSGDLEKIKSNNGLRGKIRTAIGKMTLLSPDQPVRLAAAQSILKNADPGMLELLDQALAAETDPGIKNTMELARAVTVLKTDAPVEEKRAAVETVISHNDRAAQNVLVNSLAAAPDELKPTIEAGIGSIGRTLAVWDVGQNLLYGISLSSVLLLAAIGLAITFGVMGVINMAHGEMVMLGAYATYVTQLVIQSVAPGLMEYSLAFAVPAAFLLTALVGIGIERGIIRWLYGRPLETLLATWGLSLVLQQLVRSIFGPTNKLVQPPTWMSGTFDLWNLSFTWNRLWIIVFAIAVFIALQIILNRTPLGLQMRAVTQNRRMASAMGIRTPFVDAMTFGLGSGIAGMAGVALSQIDNVSPNLGQGYIIDSFMVVVFGGVGNLWGTLIGAVTLGVANKFLEPYAGAVLAKIAILILIILFIQRRPRGLFALKGRAVEFVITQMLFRALDRKAIWLVVALCVIAVAIPFANLVIPEGNPLHLPNYAVPLFGKYLNYAMLALALDLVWGYCGILSLGHAAFFALGAYAMGMYLMRQIGARGVYANPILPDFMVFLNYKDLPWFWHGFDLWWFAFAMVLLIPGALAFAFGWFAFRSRVTGVYLSIITQAMTYALLLAFFRNDLGLGGNNGLTDFKDILGFNVQAATTRAALFAASALALALAVIICSAIVNSKLGKVMVAVRDAESRTRFLGWRPENVKLFAFVVSAVLAGIAGALYTPQVGIINPGEFDPANSIEAVIWVAVGGRGTIIGPIIGAVLVNAGKSIFTGAFPDWWLFCLGGLFIFVTLFMPKGIVGLFNKVRSRKGKEQSSAAEAGEDPSTLPQGKPAPEPAE